MQWFKDLPIARKQLLGVSVSVVLTLVLGLVSWMQLDASNRQITRITEQRMPALHAIAEMFAWVSELRTNELVLLDQKDYAAALPGFDFARKGAAESNRVYVSLLSDPRSKTLYAAVEPLYRKYLDANGEFLQATQASDFARAHAIGVDVLHPTRLEMFGKLNALKEYEQGELDKEMVAAQAAHRRAVAWIAGLSLAAALLALLAGWYIARMVGGALRRATDASEAVARGDFDTRIAVDSRDEVGRLLSSMATMQDGLRRFLGAQRDMSAAHEGGAISHRIDVAQFPGAYGDMAHGVNALVDAHLATNQQIVDVVSRYARGDLSVDIERMPGEKARITRTIDEVKQGMLATNSEIARLVAAAVRGDFAQRGDEGQFEFVYRDMIASLNQLMATTDAGLGEIDRLLAAVAGGDLTRRIDGTLAGRFGEVAQGANRTVDTLAGIVGQIRGGCDAIHTAANEIAAGNQDLSGRTEQQAAALEETSSSMEQLTGVVKANADSARDASALATEAADVAGRGGASVREVVETMAGIEASSRRIADIIGVIDGIAFQTNILALNAAVEAARAGEQGRGFAVVASEVRSLAQRSAGAAKEIKELIGESVERVQAGSSLAGNAGRTMQDVVASVDRVKALIAEISAASIEQSAGIEQVNQAIAHMDEGTQQNAALVEEATAAARSLEEQAAALAQSVAVFRTEAGAHGQVEARKVA